MQIIRPPQRDLSAFRKNVREEMRSDFANPYRAEPILKGLGFDGADDVREIYNKLMPVKEVVPLDKKSKYKYVTRTKSTKNFPWMATVTIKGGYQKYLGYFASEDEAADAVRGTLGLKDRLLKANNSKAILTHPA